MKFIEPNFEIIPQKEGLSGVFENITRAAYTCYKTNKDVTEESAKKFTETLINSHHGAMLEHGTIYLTIPWDTTDTKTKVSSVKYMKEPHTRIHWERSKEGNITTAYITTNYRVIVERGWEDDLKFMTPPTEKHEKRITVRFHMDRVGSQSVERHRVNSYAQESTRCCNYSNGKFGNEIKISVPHWVDAKSAEEMKKTYEYRNIFKSYINNDDKHYNALEYWFAANAFCEWCYMEMVKSGLPAEDARAILPLDIDSEFVMTAFESDWKYFFNLRVDGATGKPHPDIKRISEKLRKEMLEKGFKVI